MGLGHTQFTLSAVKQAYSIFSGVEDGNVLLWNAMISGFSRHAHSMGAMILFGKMQQEIWEPSSWLRLQQKISSRLNLIMLEIMPCYLTYMQLIENGIKLQDQGNFLRIVGRRRKWERVGLILYTVYAFVAPDGNHPRIMEIYEKLDDLAAEMKLDYKVEIESDLHDVEEEREDLLRHHSEKLTLAFGLIALPFGVPIRIKKNLQICRDSHTFVMLASIISGRKLL